MELDNISVSITGDSSGLVRAADSAASSIERLKAAASGSIELTAVDRASAVIDNVISRLNSVPRTTSPVIAAVDRASAAAERISAAIARIPSYKTVTVAVQQTGSIPAFAKGTQNAPEGWAVINDEKGVPDPRELVVRGGRGYLFSGRDVPVYLSRHDKVFTAAQTKELFKNLPHYASGRNNDRSERDLDVLRFDRDMGFISQEDYIGRLISYRDNNFLKWSEEYREVTLEIKEYNDSLAEEEQKLREEADESLRDSLEYRLKNYTESSDRWLEYQVKANDMATDDQIDACYRQIEAYNAMVSQMQASALYSAEEMKKIWDDFYAYRDEKMLEISDLEDERAREPYEKWQKDAQGWLDMRQIYGDWEEYGDSLVQFYERCIERVEEFYRAGAIGWQEYMDETAAYELLLYKATEEEAEQSLSSMKDKISAVKQQLQDEVSDLKASWEAEDRQKEIADVSRRLSWYEGAVTEKGQEKYRELYEELVSLEREEELFRLEEKNSRIITRLEEEYRRAEEGKSEVLASLLQVGETIAADLSGLIAAAGNTDNSVHSTVYVTAADSAELSYWVNRYASGRMRGF